MIFIWFRIAPATVMITLLPLPDGRVTFAISMALGDQVPTQMGALIA